MQSFLEACQKAALLLWQIDAALLDIIALSLKVSLSAVFWAALLGLPLGALLAVVRFPTRQLWITLLTALMGLPPVVVGLIVYINLSRNGPLGWLDLLYTPSAMIIAQTILVLPIIAALTQQTIASLEATYRPLFHSLSISLPARVWALLRDARAPLITILLAGFGRAIAEVGAVILVGGNIAHFTRTMTTTIALETSRGELSLALALGMILLVLSLAINAAAMMLRRTETGYAR